MAPLKVMTYPEASTTAQNEVDGQEIASSESGKPGSPPETAPCVSIRFGADHDFPLNEPHCRTHPQPCRTKLWRTTGNPNTGQN